jgi:hypothetical protein
MNCILTRIQAAHELICLFMLGPTGRCLSERSGFGACERAEAAKPDQRGLERLIRRGVGLLPKSSYQPSVVHAYGFAPQVAHLAHIVERSDQR